MHKGNDRVAVVTSVYNEGVALDRWVRHYTSQGFSTEDMFIVDHGSNDGSVEHQVGTHRVPFDEKREHVGFLNEGLKSEFISGFVSSLAQAYSAVIYCDCDELLVADPAIAANLVTLVMNTGVRTAIGFDVLHDVDHEAPLMPDALVSPVRAKLQLVGAMCKTIVVRFGESPAWVPGFHYSNLEPAFGGLVLFHLRYADAGLGLARLRVTREISDQFQGVNHHSLDDETFLQWVRSWSAYPLSEDDPAVLAASVAEFVNGLGIVKNAEGNYGFDYSKRSGVFYTLPNRFKGLF